LKHTKCKNIWIIDPYSEVPEKGNRSGRYPLIAKYLVLNGYTVKLFISNFSHKTKIKTHDIDDYIIESHHNVQYYIINSSTYKKNISLGRIFYERTFTKKCLEIFNSLDKPNLLIIRDPALFVSDLLVKYSKKRCLPFVVDIIDLWPELFEITTPYFLQNFAKLIFSPFYFIRSYLYKNSIGFTAVSPDYLSHSREIIHSNLPSKVIYWGCDYHHIQKFSKNYSNSILSKFNLIKKSNDFWLIYSGSLGENYDIKSIMNVSLLLKNEKNIKILIAGSGPLKKSLIDFININKCENLFYLGEIRTDDLFLLFNFCDVGLSTYLKKSTVSMPIKCYDYFAAGLPIINSLNRNLGKIIDDLDLGYNFIAEDEISLYNAILKASFNKEDLLIKKFNVKELARTFDNNIQYNIYTDFINSIKI
jgi:Glycosyl transferases group 1